MILDDHDDAPIRFVIPKKGKAAPERGPEKPRATEKVSDVVPASPTRKPRPGKLKPSTAKRELKIKTGNIPDTNEDVAVAHSDQQGETLTPTADTQEASGVMETSREQVPAAGMCF